MEIKIDNSSTNFRIDEPTSNQSNDFMSNKTENNSTDTTIDALAEETFLKKLGKKLDNICSRVMGIDL